MLDIGWPEFTLVLIVALLVIGPKDLPKALHGVGKWVRRARTITREFQRHVDDMVKESELEELRELRKMATLDKRTIAREIGKQIDPKGELKAVAKSLDTRDIGRPGQVPKDGAETDDTGAEDALPAPAADKPAAPVQAAKPQAAKPQATKASTEMTEDELAAWRENYRKARVTAAANARATPRTTPRPTPAERPAEDARPAAVDAGTEQAS